MNITKFFIKCKIDSLLQKKINLIINAEIIKQINFKGCTTIKITKNKL